MLRMLSLVLSGALLAGCGPSPSEGDATRAPSESDGAIEVWAADSAGWERFDGPGLQPSYPCAMASMGENLAVVAGRHIWRFSPEVRSWTRSRAELPRAVGEGLSVAWDPDRARLWILVGSSASVWTWNPATDELTAMPDLPAPVGRGASLSGDRSRWCVVRGDNTLDIWEADPEGQVWSALPPVGGEVRIARLGFTTGFVCVLGDAVYAWPDHHVQRFDLTTKTWGTQTWSSLGFRPHWDGGSLARDAENKLIYFAQGLGSRALGIYHPEKKRFHYLRPRAPEPIAGEGSRLALTRDADGSWLWIYAPTPSNSLWRIPLSEVCPVTRDDPRTEVGSPWQTFHEGDGASLVRHQGIEGVMGNLGERLWFLRLQHARVFDHRTHSWTRYPGLSLGHPVTAGACGVATSPRDLYVLPGATASFLRVDLEAGVVTGLQDAPAAAGLGAALATLDRHVYALRGGETRDVWAFDTESARWESGPALPESSPVIGRGSTGLCSDGARLFVCAGTDLLSWAPSETAWERRGSLGFACAADGGMVAFHDATRSIYLVEGAVSRRLGRYRVDARRFEFLEPPLPDGVSVPGNRLVLAEDEGGPWLMICRGHDSHEMWRVRLADLRVLETK